MMYIMAFPRLQATIGPTSAPGWVIFSYNYWQNAYVGPSWVQQWQTCQCLANGDRWQPNTVLKSPNVGPMSGRWLLVVCDAFAVKLIHCG